MSNRILGYFGEPWEQTGPVPPPPDDRTAGYRAGNAWAIRQPGGVLSEIDLALSVDVDSWDCTLEDPEYLDDLIGQARAADIVMEDTPVFPAERFHLLISVAADEPPPVWSRPLAREFWRQHGPNGSIPDRDYLTGFAAAAQEIRHLWNRPFYRRRELPDFNWYAALLRYQDAPAVLMKLVIEMPEDILDDLFDTMMAAYAASRESVTVSGSFPESASPFLNDSIGNAIAHHLRKDFRFEDRLVVG